jgi:prophage antirepressor-like protein
MIENFKPVLIYGVSCYEQDGTAYLRLEDVAHGLGFTQTKNGIEYVRWETIDKYLRDLGFSQQVGKDSYIPENIFYRLAMKAKNETAEKFQALVADEIIPSIRKTGSYTVPKLSKEMQALFLLDQRTV